MSAWTVLVVDDDADIRELVAMYLRDHQINAIEAENGESALRQFHAFHPDLVVLDVILPGMDGFDVARKIREQSPVPIVFLTSRSKAEDAVTGLDLGGDDYVTKPFMPNVLVARVKSHLRRGKPGGPNGAGAIRFGDLHIRTDTHEVWCRGQPIPFLAKEFKLFLYLAERPRQVFHAEQLYEQIWNDLSGDARTVMVHISNIRKKLELHAPDRVTIETIKGAGYRLVPVERLEPGLARASLREAIIEEASGLFAARGYEGMRMKEIAARVGIHPSAIYAVFKNKEELFLEIYRNVLGGHQQLAIGHAGATDAENVGSQLEGLFRSIIQFQLKEAGKMKIFIRMLLLPSGHFREERNLKAELVELEREECEWFAALLRKGMRNGEIREGDGEALAKLLICLLDGLFWEMQRYDRDAFLEQFEVIWEQFWRLVKAGA